MKLEDQVVSLELAKQLKEAGYPQDESIHYWGLIDGSGGVWCKHVIDQMDSREKRFEWIAAPTVAELFDQLPSDFFILKGWFEKKPENNYSCARNGHPHNEDKWAKIESTNDLNPANAAAKMWLYLKKEGLV